MIPAYPTRELAIGIPSRTVTYFSGPARKQRVAALAAAAGQRRAEATGLAGPRGGGVVVFRQRWAQAAAAL